MGMASGHAAMMLRWPGATAVEREAGLQHPHSEALKLSVHVQIQRTSHFSVGFFSLSDS